MSQQPEKKRYVFARAAKKAVLFSIFPTSLKQAALFLTLSFGVAPATSLLFPTAEEYAAKTAA